MGRRMSVTEICARMEPSTYSTREWTVDWGWTVTRTWLGRHQKAASLNDFKPLVEHGGGVDSDAASHDPGGMLEGLLWVIEANCRGSLSKGPARCREPDRLDFGMGADAKH